VYRGGTWLLPFHRMVLLPRSFAADAHDCIMVVGLRDPTEYKVVAREFRVPWHGSSTRINGLGVMSAIGGWTGSAPRQGSRLRAPASRLSALTRPRSQSVWLGIVSALCADTRPRTKREFQQTEPLDK
jgi:hypothetical protein